MRKQTGFSNQLDARVLTQAISVALVGLALSLSGCGSNSSSGLQDQDPVGYIERSCAFNAEEGDHFSNFQSSTPVVNGYFGKPYNRDWLLNVGHSSIRDTLKFIERTGSRVYHADPISKKSCKYLGFAAEMPSDIRAEWKKAEGNGMAGFLTGLYLMKGSHGRRSLVNDAAIIVREDANRWTLVHEFMHHNFKTQAASKQGYDDDLSLSKDRLLMDQLKKLLDQNNISAREKVKRGTPLFLELVQNSDQLVIQYAFEEIAVEATMQDKYDSGDLTFVPPSSYENATWYIQHSKESAQAFYSALDKLYGTLTKLAIFNGGRWPEYFQLTEYEELKQKRLNQIDEMMKDRAAKKARLTSLSEVHSLPILSAFKPEPCAHIAEIDRAVNDLVQSVEQMNLSK